LNLGVQIQGVLRIFTFVDGLNKISRFFIFLDLLIVGNFGQVEGFVAERRVGLFRFNDFDEGHVFGEGFYVIRSHVFFGPIFGALN
jgi:hypothetical protein